MKRVFYITIAALITVAGLADSTAAQQFDPGKLIGGGGGRQFGQQLRQQFQQPAGQFGQQFGQQLQQQFVQNAGGFTNQLGQQMGSGGGQIIDQVQQYLPPQITQELRNTLQPGFIGGGGEWIVEPPVVEPPIIVDPPCNTNPPTCTTPPGTVAPAWQSRPWNQPMYPGTPVEYGPQPEVVVPAQPALEPKSDTETAAETPLDELEEVEAGSVVSIEGREFGAQPGGVYLKVNEMLMSTKLVGWSDSVAQAELPSLPIVGASRAILIVMTAESTIGQTMEVSLVPASSEEAEEEVAIDESDEEEVAYSEDADDEETEMISGGEQLSLEGEFGAAKGSVALRIASMNFQARIISWTESSVEFEVPALETTEAQAAELVIRNGDDDVVDTYEVSYAAGKN